VAVSEAGDNATGTTFYYRDDAGELVAIFTPIKATESWWLSNDSVKGILLLDGGGVKASSELFQIKILAVINNHDIAKSGRVEFAKPTPLSCLIYQTCLVGCGNLNFTDVHCIYLPSRLSNASLSQALSECLL
jgi:hypothetical protein